MAEECELVVVDTDCGVDDAMALLLTLSDKKCRLLAVTCCFGNTELDNVCTNVMRVLTVCNDKEIPIYRGCRGPLLNRGKVISEIHHGKDGLGNVAHEFPTGGIVESPGPAASVLVKLSLDYPGKINLVAIGPLSNVALAHRLDPLFTKRLKSIVCMGGSYKCVGNETAVAEYNFYCDPEAVDIVLGEAFCPITLVPWETTLDFGIEWDMVDRLLEIQTVKGDFFNRISKYSFERNRMTKKKKSLDCDLLAVAALLHPDCVTQVLERPLAVETGGHHSRGMMVLLRDANAGNRNSVRIVTAFNQEMLNELRYNMLQ